MDFNGVKIVLGRMDVDTSSLRPNQKGQVIISCPLAPWLHEGGKDSRPGCSILVNHTPSLFKCFACGEQGKLSDLVDSFAELSDRDDLRKLALELFESDKPSLTTTLAGIRQTLDSWVYDVMSDTPRPLNLELMSYSRFPAYDTNPQALHYVLRKRKLHPSIAKLFDLRYDPRQHRVVFPVYDDIGRLFGAVGRAISDETQPKYWNYFGFTSGKSLGGLNHTSGHSKVLVSEGWTDVAKTFQWAQDLRFDSVCTWHADLSVHQADQLSSLDATLYFCYDNDLAGKKGWERAQKLLGRSCVIRRLEPPHSVDLGDMDESQFKSFVNP